MGISYRIPVPVVRTGVERATLVRRTYALVFASVLVTIAGAAFGLSQPTIMEQVAAHPIITMLLMFAPLFMAMRARTAFPANVGLKFMFTFVEGLFLSRFLYIYGRTPPGLLGHAGLLSQRSFAGPTAYGAVRRRRCR